MSGKFQRRQMHSELTRTLARGDICLIDNTTIQFPDNPINQFNEEDRPVIIFQNLDLIRTGIVLVIPVTTKIYTMTDSCLLLQPEDGVLEESLAKVGLIQPILTDDIERRVGRLTPEALERVTAKHLQVVGIIYDTESQPEVEVSSNDRGE